jgi:hypothetical protein
MLIFPVSAAYHVLIPPRALVDEKPVLPVLEVLL